MTERLQAIRGMNDILPLQASEWRKLETCFIDCVKQYGYQEIRLPLVESTHLFKRTIGEVTDIVEKEMYTFVDLNGESISLRPEGTAGTVRACLEHGLLYHQQQRLWYMGPMFRHEKPQKGRYRQFHHFGVEVFGMAGPMIELELLAMCARLWKQLAVHSFLRLELNTLGSLEERHHYRQQLVDYFLQHKHELDEESIKRLERNPLRILDSKNPNMQALIKRAPRMLDVLGEESRQHFEALCVGLDALGIDYTVNPQLVRGLDYYSHTVFEWVTDRLGSQATVCAGGRYDGLVLQLGGAATPAVGFAMGVERLILLLQSVQSTVSVMQHPDIFIIADSTAAAAHSALSLAEELREAVQWEVMVNLSGGSFKSQFKKADKVGATVACILGETELQTNTIGLKWLRKELPQITCTRSELINLLKRELNTCPYN